MKVLSNLMGNGSKIKYTEVVCQKDNTTKNIKEYIDESEVYSTSEVKTNKVWIDGKPIYRKVINIGNLPNSASKSISTGVNFNNAKLVNLYGFCKYSTNNICFPLPFSHPSTLSYSIMINIDNSNNVVVTSGSDRSGYSGYVIIEYTKTTD